MSGKGVLFSLIGVVIAALMLDTVFIIDERKKAIVFMFGEIVDSNLQPGLHYKIPFVQKVKYYDARVQTMDADPELYLTGEKKNLVVDSFVKWRIRDVHQYYTRLQGLQSNARSRLSQRVNDSLRQEFGRRSVQEVISGDRSEIMDVVRLAMDEDAASLGIEIIDVRLKRVDLDPAISERVYERMNAERARVANEFRAEGEEEAEKIRANADRERAILLAEAERDGQRIRGEGDAVATDIYARAFGKDREFYNLYRSLNAYKQTFDGKENLMVLDPSSDFFRYFKQPRVPSN
jgi:membrane protease subunit HflC